MNSSLVASTVFPPQLQCIYCNATDVPLSKEHIIPRALGGNYVLPKSSCQACGTITSQFEQRMLRGPMWPVRAHLQIGSRHASLAPKTARAFVTRNGVESAVDVPLVDHPLLLYFPLFSPPSVLTGMHVEGISVAGEATIQFGRQGLRDLAVSLNADNVRLAQSHDVVSFARVLAKIAWGFASAEGFRARIDPQASVLPALLREPNQIGRWVGTTGPVPSVRLRGMRHDVSLLEEGGYLCCVVRLFGDSGGPAYSVIIGALTDQPTRSSAEHSLAHRFHFSKPRWPAFGTGAVVDAPTADPGVEVTFTRSDGEVFRTLKRV